MGDGKTKYDSAHDGASNKLAGCESDFRESLIPTKGRITYHRDSKTLNVRNSS